MRGLNTIGLSLVLLTEVSCQSRYFRTNLAGRVYPADYDRNGDGITDIQAIRAGFDPADPTLATQDPDGDGLSNYWEFKLGFDPNKADSDNSKVDKKTGGNGVGDCDEDLVGDGIGVCWKIKNKFKPTEGNRSLTDADSDAYSDGEEFSANTDPNDATSRPGGSTAGTVGSDGKLAPVLTIKGTNATYTTSLNTTGTMSFCTTGEKILFTSSKTKPSVDDPGFVDCTTTADALIGTLASGAAGNRVMFAWRKIAAGVVDVPLSASILFTNRAVAGGLEIIPAGDQTLAVALVPPADAQYGTVKLLRFSDLDCSTKTTTSAGATEVAVNPGDTLVTVGNLPLGSNYCFKVFWTDDKGNVITADDGYDGTPPPAGSLSIFGYETKTIKLSHTPPTSAKYEKLVLKRFESLTCADKLATEGTEVPLGMTATTYSDTNLSFGTPYCYKIFWSDNLGNNNSATVTYDGPPTGADLALLGMQKTGASSGTVELRLTRPAPPPTHTVLERYGDNDCSAGGSSSLALTDPMPSSYDKTDNIDATTGGFKTYCYKAKWSDDFGNSVSDVVVAKFYPPTITISPTTFTYTAPAAGTAVTVNSSGTITYTANSFNSIFYTNSASLTPLLGNGAGSILTTTNPPVNATSTESDVPGLQFSTSAGCDSSSATIFCSTPVLNYVISNTNNQVETTGVFNWQYTKFDQGEYFLRTLGGLSLNGTNYYSAPSDGLVKVQTPNLGNEEVLFADASQAINWTFSQLSSWARFSPSIAISDRLSTSHKQVFGIAYSAYKQSTNQFFNTTSVDFSKPVNEALKKGFDSNVDSTTRLNNTLKDSFRTADSSAATTYSSIVASVGSSSDGPDWLILSNIADKLQLTTFKQSSSGSGPDENSVSRIRLSKDVAGLSFGGCAISDAFMDDVNGTKTARHGIAFTTSISGKFGVFVTKIRSKPLTTTFTELRDKFLDSYSNNLANTAFPESITITSNLDYEPDNLKITTSSESGNNYFYVSWRAKNLPTDTDKKLFFAKMRADGTSNPTIYKTNVPNLIGDMGNPSSDGGWGRASYSIAAGKTGDSVQKDILGVLYSTVNPDGSSSKCKFQAYQIVSDTLVKMQTDEKIGVDDFSSSDCRFAHLFWNQNSQKFMALWVEGDEPPLNSPPTQDELNQYYFGPTYYAEFKYAADSESLINKTISVVTADRAGASKRLVCTMGATFSSNSAGTSTPRISIVTIESNECFKLSADMKIDFYKPSL